MEGVGRRRVIHSFETLGGPRDRGGLCKREDNKNALKQTDRPFSFGAVRARKNQLDSRVTTRLTRGA